MKKTYCLYLDESGDFDKDLKCSWKNECLVGGYLVEKEKCFNHFEARKIIADAWRKVYPEDAGINDEEAFQKITHANEIEINKAEICYEVLTNMHEKAEFIIFENYKKTEIVSSSRLYLNILVDGIMQLLTKLIFQNCGDTVCLEVLVGYRRNTSHEEDIETVGIYIADSEYKKRINEKLLLERIKRPAIFSSNSSVSLQCDYDKYNHFIIPCDYICNFYITRTAKEFRKEFTVGITYNECLLKLYKKENIFHLNGSAERERVLNYVESQTYDAALFDICTGIIKNEDCQKSILKNITALREKQVQNILSGLSGYMNNVIEVERNIESSLDYLKKAEQIIQKLSNAGFRVEAYCMDIKLYELAVYDHRGNLDEMGRLFKECYYNLKKIISRAENIDYAFIFFNRYAVYLYDIFEFEKGYKFLENLKKCFEAYELIFSDFPELSEEKMHSAQLGKILGTQVQYCRHMMRQGKMEYEDAVNISNLAIDNFELEKDRRRQYQYRTQIEAEAGHYDVAIEFLKKGWELRKWEDIFSQEKRSPFAMYHLSFLMERFSRDEAIHEDIKKMLKKFRDNETTLFTYTDFPSFLICANIAKTMIRLKMDETLIRKYFQQALVREHSEDIQPLFSIFILMIHSDYVGWLIEKGKDVEKEINSMSDVLEAVSEKVQVKSIKILCEQLHDILLTRDAEKYFEFGNRLQY